MKKLFALCLVVVLLTACTNTPDPALSTPQDNISVFVSALFTLPLAEVAAMPDRDEVVMTSDSVGYLKAGEVASEALITAVKPYVSDKLLDTLANKASNTPGLMLMLTEVGYSLKVDNVYTEAGKDKEYTAFALLELTDPKGQVWHGLVDLNLRVDDKGLVEYWKTTTDAELTLMALCDKLGLQQQELAWVKSVTVEDALLR